MHEQLGRGCDRDIRIVRSIPRMRNLIEDPMEGDQEMSNSRYKPDRTVIGQPTLGPRTGDHPAEKEAARAERPKRRLSGHFYGRRPSPIARSPF